MPDELEGHHLALRHRELGHRCQIAARDLHGCDEHQRVRTGDGAQTAVGAAHPRHDPAVVEPDDELHLHRHPSAPALDEAHDVELVVAWWHAVDHRHLALVGGEHGLEHE